MNNILTAIPVIISLVIMEGLLSVDNILAISAMATALPTNQQAKALRFGMIGAFVMRGLCLAFAAWLIHWWWLKLAGGLYLIYLSVSTLTKGDEEEGGAPNHLFGTGFWKAVLAIELVDLSLSIDNIAAAVAIDKRLWVVILGVCLGIVALRIAAGYCVSLMEKYPILAKTAFVLVGYVGVLLLVELGFEFVGHPVEISAYVKFVGIASIVAASLVYQKCSKPEIAV